MTLLEAVTNWMEHQRCKHGFDDDYSEKLVNQMSQYDFLQAISEALEEMNINEIKKGGIEK